MKTLFTEKAKRQLKKIDRALYKKIHKQLAILQKDRYHPSLQFRKMANTTLYEGRIDYQYRFTGTLVGEDFYITAIGPHDSGLGKK